MQPSWDLNTSESEKMPFFSTTAEYGISKLSLDLYFQLTHGVGLDVVKEPPKNNFLFKTTQERVLIVSFPMDLIGKSMI